MSLYDVKDAVWCAVTAIRVTGPFFSCDKNSPLYDITHIFTPVPIICPITTKLMHFFSQTRQQLTQEAFLCFLESVIGDRMINKIVTSSFTGAEPVSSIFSCREILKLKVQ